MSFHNTPKEEALFRDIYNSFTGFNPFMFNPRVLPSMSNLIKLVQRIDGILIPHAMWGTHPFRGVIIYMAIPEK